MLQLFNETVVGPAGEVVVNRFRALMTYAQLISMFKSLIHERGKAVMAKMKRYTPASEGNIILPFVAGMWDSLASEVEVMQDRESQIGGGNYVAQMMHANNNRLIDLLGLDRVVGPYVTLEAPGGQLNDVGGERRGIRKLVVYV